MVFNHTHLNHLYLFNWLLIQNQVVLFFHLCKYKTKLFILINLYNLDWRQNHIIILMFLMLLSHLVLKQQYKLIFIFKMDRFYLPNQHYCINLIYFLIIYLIIVLFFQSLNSLKLFYNHQLYLWFHLNLILAILIFVSRIHYVIFQIIIFCSILKHQQWTKTNYRLYNYYFYLFHHHWFIRWSIQFQLNYNLSFLKSIINHLLVFYCRFEFLKIFMLIQLIVGKSSLLKFILNFYI